MLNIVLSEPMNEKKIRYVETVGHDDFIRFNRLLCRIGEDPSTWWADLNDLIEAKCKGNAWELTYRDMELDVLTNIDKSDITYGVNNGMRVSINNIILEDHNAGMEYDLTAYSANGTVLTFVMHEREEVGSMGVHMVGKHVYRMGVPRTSGRYPWGSTAILPQIDYVRTFGDPIKTIRVDFVDGTCTVATCSDADRDIFSFETGLGICIAKRVMGKEFNKSIRKAKKVYEQGIKLKENEEKLKAEQKTREKRRREKAEARRQRRAHKRIQEMYTAIYNAVTDLIDEYQSPVEEPESHVPEKPALTDELVQEMREKNNDYNSEQKLDNI